MLIQCAYYADTNDSDDNDSNDIMKEYDTNISKRYDNFGHFSCHKCSQVTSHEVKRKKA